MNAPRNGHNEAHKTPESTTDARLENLMPGVSATHLALFESHYNGGAWEVRVRNPDDIRATDYPNLGPSFDDKLTAMGLAKGHHAKHFSQQNFNETPPWGNRGHSK